MLEASTKRAVFIVSCDKYADLWQGFIQSMKTSWPDCPYKIYFLSNEEIIDNAEVVNIRSGPDISWSDSFISGLKQIKEESLFVWLDDAYLCTKPDSQLFDTAFSQIETGVIAHIHFRPVPKPEQNIGAINKDIGRYERGSPYSVNVVGFWNRKVLMSLLIPGESPWNFEVFGSYRMQYIGDCGCLLRQPFEYIHLVEKGRWLPRAHETLLANGYDVDITTRPLTNGMLQVISNTKSIFFKLVMSIAWRKRLAVINVMRKILATY